MNYELRGKNHTMCDWLGFSKEDSLYPNHVRAFTADELPRVPRRGFYHGLNGQADAVTSTADEQREEDEAASSGLALPVSIPKSWLSTGALRTAMTCMPVYTCIYVYARRWIWTEQSPNRPALPVDLD